MILREAEASRAESCSLGEARFRRWENRSGHSTQLMALSKIEGLVSAICEDDADLEQVSLFPFVLSTFSGWPLSSLHACSSITISRKNAMIILKTGC